jgi:hypothetical protein
MKLFSDGPTARSAVQTCTALAIAALATSVWSSSHREAPFTAMNPSVDATDLYMFKSYEAGRGAFVTILANYTPFQDPQGGPNFYMFNPNALYEIHIDNTGSGSEAMTFQFRFTNTSKAATLNVGGKAVKIPLIAGGTLSGATPATRPSAGAVTPPMPTSSSTTLPSPVAQPTARCLSGSERSRSTLQSARRSTCST